MLPQTFIFQSRSGSGKGTQVVLLKEYLEKYDPGRKVLRLETGKQFRELASKNTFTGLCTKEVLDRGGLPPEFLAIWIWAGFFIEAFTGDEHLIFDGFPRRAHEAAMLHIALQFYKRTQAHFVELKTSREWSFARLKGRGRYDDTDTSITRRLDWYETEVVPTIDFFKDHSDYYLVHDINGEQTVEKVHADIMDALGLP